MAGLLHSLAPQPSLGGSYVICCIHGMEKDRSHQLFYDVNREKPAQCVCCGNVFAYEFNRSDPPLLCPQCNRGGSNG